MAIICARCGREYDVTLFSFGRSVRCACGGVVRAGEPHRGPPVPGLGRTAGRRAMEELSRGADRIASLILYSDLDPVDVDIAIERLRDRAEELFPGRGWLFEAVYEARFRRLREQW